MIHGGQPTAFLAKGCGCTPSLRPSTAGLSDAPDKHRPPVKDAAGHRVEQCQIPGGEFSMGDASGDHNPSDGELPLHSVSLPAFAIDATTVTNADFRRFIDATGHVTDAERFGSSAVFIHHIQAHRADVLGAAATAPWWWDVRGADWAHPAGPLSSTHELADHPVVHVSWFDAIAYCEWANRRLPTEAEWEYASRGGLHGTKYPWGNAEVTEGGWRANIWQGEFPRVDTAADGWSGTAPVRSYAPNAWGLWQTVGNVWEWCADWFAPDAYVAASNTDPKGPALGATRVLRGGSFLCHNSYCNRYRNSARSANTPDSSMSNAGFRTVALSPSSTDQETP